MQWQISSLRNENSSIAPHKEMVGTKAHDIKKRMFTFSKCFGLEIKTDLKILTMDKMKHIHMTIEITNKSIDL